MPAVRPWPCSGASQARRRARLWRGLWCFAKVGWWRGQGWLLVSPLGTAAAVRSPKGPQLPSCAVAVNSPGPRKCVCVCVSIRLSVCLSTSLPSWFCHAPSPHFAPRHPPRAGGAGATARPGPAPHGCSPCGGWSILSRAIGLVSPRDRGVAPSGCCSAPAQAARCAFARCRGSQPRGWDGARWLCSTHRKR